MGKNISEEDLKKVTGGVSNKSEAITTIDDVDYTPTDDISDDTKEKIKG